MCLLWNLFFIILLVTSFYFPSNLSAQEVPINPSKTELCDYLAEIPLDLWEERTLYFQHDIASRYPNLTPIIENHYGIFYDLSVMGSEFNTTSLITNVAAINAELMDVSVSISGVQVLNGFTIDVARLKRYVGKYHPEGRQQMDRFVLEITPSMAQYPEKIFSSLLQENPLTESEMYRKKIQQARRETVNSIFDTEEDKNSLGANIARASGKAISVITDHMEGISKINLGERFKNMVIVDEFDKSFEDVFDLSQMNSKDTADKSCSDAGQENTVGLQRQGIQQLLQEQYAQAAATFKTALEQSPGVVKLYNALAFALISQGDLAQAAGYLQKTAPLKPEEAYVYSNLGLVYYELGDDQKALENLMKALEINPEMVGLNLYLGYSYVFLSDNQRALPYLIKAEEFQQNNAEFMLVLANSYQALNQNDLAKIYFEKTRQLNPALLNP